MTSKAPCFSSGTFVGANLVERKSSVSHLTTLEVHVERKSSVSHLTTLEVQRAIGARHEVYPRLNIPKCAISRRHFTRIGFSGLFIGAYLQPDDAHHAQAVPSPFATPEDLTARFRQKVSKRPEAKLFQEDIFYPDYFAGVWRTESTLLAVACPAGYKLFGRAGSFEAAKGEIGKPQGYQSRFIRSRGHVISDRPFNVTSIAQASMGPSSVLDCTQPETNPNHMTMSIRPAGAGGAVFTVDIRTIARQQQDGPVPENIESCFKTDDGTVVSEGNRENRSGCRMGVYTSETMRQEVRPDTNDLRVSPLIKEVETTTLFITDPRGEDYLEGWQRTSCYLTRSNLQYGDARGRPIDVRWYRLTYFKR